MPQVIFDKTEMNRITLLYHTPDEAKEAQREISNKLQSLDEAVIITNENELCISTNNPKLAYQILKNNNVIQQEEFDRLEEKLKSIVLINLKKSRLENFNELWDKYTLSNEYQDQVKLKKNTNCFFSCSAPQSQLSLITSIHKALLNRIKNTTKFLTAEKDIYPFPKTNTQLSSPLFIEFLNTIFNYYPEVFDKTDLEIINSVCNRNSNWIWIWIEGFVRNNFQPILSNTLGATYNERQTKILAPFLKFCSPELIEYLTKNSFCFKSRDYFLSFGAENFKRASFETKISLAEYLYDKVYFYFPTIYALLGDSALEYFNKSDADKQFTMLNCSEDFDSKLIEKLYPYAKNKETTEKLESLEKKETEIKEINPEVKNAAVRQISPLINNLKKTTLKNINHFIKYVGNYWRDEIQIGLSNILNNANTKLRYFTLSSIDPNYILIKAPAILNLMTEDEKILFTRKAIVLLEEASQEYLYEDLLLPLNLLLQNLQSSYKDEVTKILIENEIPKDVANICVGYTM